MTTQVDEYNAWIRQHFGENASLLKSKINEPPIAIMTSATGPSGYLTKPFNASSDLSKFGKQQVYAVNSQNGENDVSQQNLRNL